MVPRRGRLLHILERTRSQERAGVDADLAVAACTGIFDARHRAGARVADDWSGRAPAPVWRSCSGDTPIL